MQNLKSLRPYERLTEHFSLLKYICKMIANLCKKAISSSCIMHEHERPILKRFQIIRYYQEFSRWNLNTPTCTALITAAEWADRKAKRRHGQDPPQVICTHNLKPRWPQDKSKLQVRVIIDGEWNHRISMYISTVETDSWRWNGSITLSSMDDFSYIKMVYLQF